MSSSKTITTTKRLCTAFIPSQASSSTSAAVAVFKRRPRALSASSSSVSPANPSSPHAGERRTFYSAATGANQSPLQFFDAASSIVAGSGSPSPCSRPGNPHLLSSQRLTYVESQQSNSSSGTGSQSQYGGSQQSHSSTANQPLHGSSSFSTTVNSHPSYYSQPDRLFTLNSSHARFYESLSASPSLPLSSTGQSSDVHLAGEPPTSNSPYGSSRKLFQLDVGAYGIPKRGLASRSASEHAELAGLDAAVQVGEDAYFIQEDAMGVADGVGGWASSCRGKSVASDLSSTRSSALRSSIRRDGRHGPSPSALFARRLMHFCAIEAADARTRAQVQAGDLSIEIPATHLGSAKQQPSSPSFLSPKARCKTPRTYDHSARPFLWPWEEESVSNISTERASCKESNEHVTAATDDMTNANPLEILERAYTRAIDAHIEYVPADLQAETSEYDVQLASLSEVRTDHNKESTNLERRPLRLGSSTALLATLSGDRLRVAHLGDCTGLLIRAGEVVWRSEEMWWGFNCPLQLGPSSPTSPRDARTYELHVQADDILVLASDGMSDNLWEEDVVDEIQHFTRSLKPRASPSSSSPSLSSSCVEDQLPVLGALGRRALAGMLSEALCSRARRVSEQTRLLKISSGDQKEQSNIDNIPDDLPFSRRAKEEGKPFRGGKCDDITVLVAVITASI